MDLWRETHGPESQSMTYVHNALGNAYRMKGALEEARQHFERALAIAQKSMDGHGLVQGLRTNLGRLDQAMAALERALAIRERPGASPWLRARARFELAQVLWTRPDDRDRALALARTAHEDLLTTDLAGDKAEVAAWLAARR